MSVAPRIEIIDFLTGVPEPSVEIKIADGQRIDGVGHIARLSDRLFLGGLAVEVLSKHVPTQGQCGD